MNTLCDIMHMCRPTQSVVRLCSENVLNLAIPKTNAEVWEVLNRGVQIVDLSVQQMQALQAAALSVILCIKDQIGCKVVPNYVRWYNYN